ncbi:hypothetical protein ACWHAQ_31815, partial [Streptomyces koyangensis]
MGEDARFMQAPKEGPARYRIPRRAAELALRIERVLRNRIEVSDPAESARRIVSSPEALSILAKDKDGLTVLRAAEMQRRSASLRPTARNDRRRHHDLAVLTRSVVDAADRRLASECGVAAVVVVGVEE